jgi:hypothetical protein
VLEKFDALTESCLNMLNENSMTTSVLTFLFLLVLVTIPRTGSPNWLKKKKIDFPVFYAFKRGFICGCATYFAAQ